ncbi:EthD family reductase [Microlunatus speluncae]|uniref:EthD family reductase n=1 Tax=Microlunatus speluncae TaxID=2594267 RepID=UPI0012663AF8|nr:EthD family reductase [Microlunatus speluncae]
MYKLVVLYRTPDSPPDFDRYYNETHIPIAKGMRGLTRWTVTKFEPAPDGTPPEFYYAAELYAETRADLEAILTSEEGEAAWADVANFASGGAVRLFGPEEDVPVA